MGLNSKPLPVVGGVQWLGRSPIGTKIAPNRLVGVAAVRAVRVRAGTMASSKGSDRVAPMPRSTVRRDTDDLVMNMTLLYLLGLREDAATCGSELGAFSRFWNGTLRTTPRTTVENRYWSFSASRTMDRTVGMSAAVNPRPSA